MDNLTPLTPPEARRITPEDQPVYPCWLYHNPNGWWRANAWPFVCDVGEENTHWHPDQPTPPTQPPAPLAGGTEPATSEREAELRECLKNAATSALGTALAAHFAGDTIDQDDIEEVAKVMSAALTPLLDRREGELENARFATRQHQQYAHMMQEQRSEIARAYNKMEAELAALRTLVAKQREALLAIYDPRTKGWGLNPDNARIVEQALALTPASIADELAVKDAQLKALSDSYFEQMNIAAEMHNRALTAEGQLTATNSHMDKLREHRNDLDAACHELEGKLHESEAARATAQETIESLQDEIRELGERD